MIAAIDNGAFGNVAASFGEKLWTYHSTQIQAAITGSTPTAIRTDHRLRALCGIDAGGILRASFGATGVASNSDPTERDSSRVSAAARTPLASNWGDRSMRAEGIAGACATGAKEALLVLSADGSVGKSIGVIGCGGGRSSAISVDVVRRPWRRTRANIRFGVASNHSTAVSHQAGFVTLKGQARSK